jgi:hypothetical protein
MRRFVPSALVSASAQWLGEAPSRATARLRGPGRNGVNELHGVLSGGALRCGCGDDKTGSSPAWPAAPRRRPEAFADEDASHGARRDAHTQLQQFAGDPRVAPAWVLSRQAQNKLTHATLDRRPAGAPLSLRPLPPHEFSVPAQERLRRHDQPLSPSRRKQPCKRREEGAIGGTESGARLLPTQHRKLMPQNEQLDVLGEVAAPPG